MQRRRQGRVRQRPERLSSETWHFASYHARVERDAELDWVDGRLRLRAGARSGSRTTSPIAGATSRVTGAYFADGDQHLDYDTYQLHQAPDTTSDFAFKGALRDTRRDRLARDDPCRGGRPEDERVPGEPQPPALEDGDTPTRSPGLEILANDVRCTHGATLSQVDREQLFYLMARGLSRSEAERLIVRGFFQDVLDRIELEPVRDALGAALEARIPQA